jgi:tRNA threonylcarbamoyladenosine biosynthesis protein TsaE
MILALSGPLGAGKTTFVQELVAFLGSKDVPKSPTFSLLRTYRLQNESFKRLLHVDAYRIENEAEMMILNLDEELEESGTIAAIEWPEQIPLWMTERADRVVWLTIKFEEGGRRVAEVMYRG